MTTEFNAGMEFAAQIVDLCTAWYEGHGDKVGTLAAEEIRARIGKPTPPTLPAPVAKEGRES